jgi:thiamine pyrophosphate-dependent acetolactate synthase large subunit-like protein
VLKSEIAPRPVEQAPNSAARKGGGTANFPSSSYGRGAKASALATQTLEAIRAAERPLLLAGAAVMRSDGFRNAQTTFREAGLVGMENPRGIFF